MPTYRCWPEDEDEEDDNYNYDPIVADWPVEAAELFADGLLRDGDGETHSWLTKGVICVRRLAEPALVPIGDASRFTITIDYDPVVYATPCMNEKETT